MTSRVERICWLSRLIFMLSALAAWILTVTETTPLSSIRPSAMPIISSTRLRPRCPADAAPRDRRRRLAAGVAEARIVLAAIQGRADADPAVRRYPRSEEHTSELQSRGQLVCRLL